jgi:hypothetical protein
MPPQCHRSLRRRADFALKGLIIGCTLLLAACSPARTLESIDILRDIQARDQPSPLKAETATPERRAVNYQVQGRWREGDLYQPGGGEAVRGGIVLVPGLTPKGRNDPRIVAFASTLARGGFSVLVPDLLPMRSHIAAASDAQPIADAICHLSDHASDRPLGVTAVSFALGPAILALFEPQAQGRTSFVLGIGGYYDMPALITFITTGSVRDAAGTGWTYQPPSEFGKYVFLITAATRLDSLDDRMILLDIASRRLDDHTADVSDLTARLGPEGQAVAAVLNNTVPDQAAALLAALPAPVRDEIAALDLRSRDLRALGVEFILVHDRQDRVVPSEQSTALGAAVGDDLSAVYLVDGLEHANPGRIGVRDAALMISAIYRVLEYRDGAVARGDQPMMPPCQHLSTPAAWAIAVNSEREPAALRR